MPLLKQVLEQNPKNVKLVFKHFPLPNHRFAKKAAAAAMVAHKKGLFWEFHDKLYENASRLSDQKLQDIAGELSLDGKDIQKSMRDPEIQAAISQDLRDAKAAGVRGTPTIFVNGRLLRNRSVQGFQALIDGELKKLEKSGN